MRQKLVAGNWKSNGNLQFAARLVDDLLAELASVPDGVDIVVCPTFICLSEVAQRVAGSRIHLGAQNSSPFEEGAYTGEIAASMLKSVGCGYVILGHSERRSLCFESDEFVARKIVMALETGLIPILCVGETIAQRRSGDALMVVEQQLKVALESLKVNADSSLVVAYEPVWAIGTGETAATGQVAEMHGHIRKCLFECLGEKAGDIQILYGGSVKSHNAAELMSLQNVDGALVGGASLDKDEFLTICRVAGEN